MLYTTWDTKPVVTQHEGRNPTPLLCRTPRHTIPTTFIHSAPYCFYSLSVLLIYTVPILLIELSPFTLCSLKALFSDILRLYSATRSDYGSFYSPTPYSSTHLVLLTCFYSLPSGIMLYSFYLLHPITLNFALFLHFRFFFFSPLPLLPPTPKSILFKSRTRSLPLNHSQALCHCYFTPEDYSCPPSLVLLH